MHPTYFTRLFNSVPEAVRWEYRSKGGLLDPIWSLPVSELEGMHFGVSSELLSLAIISRLIESEAPEASTWETWEERLGESFFEAMLAFVDIGILVQPQLQRLLGYLSARSHGERAITVGYVRALLVIGHKGEAIEVASRLGEPFLQVAQKHAGSMKGLAAQVLMRVQKEMAKKNGVSFPWPALYGLPYAPLGPLLDALLEARALWEQTRNAEAADVVHNLQTRLPPPPSFASPTQREAWANFLAHEHDPASVSYLLALPWPTKASDLHIRLIALKEFPPDPRIGRAIFEALQEARWSSLSYYAADAIEVAGLHSDPPLREALKKLPFPAGLGPRWQEVWNKRMAELNQRPDARALTPEQSARLTALKKQIGFEEVRDLNKIQAQFLAEILAQPDQDAPRLVYADFLVEQKDPRGEFIQLQCAPPTPAGRRREAALWAEQGAIWSSSLGNVSHTGTIFRRGFADSVLLRIPWNPTAFDNPAWQTVRTLVLGGQVAASEVGKWLDHPYLTEVREVYGWVTPDRPTVALRHLSGLGVWLPDHTVNLSDLKALKKLALVSTWPMSAIRLGMVTLPAGVGELEIANAAFGELGKIAETVRTQSPWVHTLVYRYQGSSTRPELWVLRLTGEGFSSAELQYFPGASSARIGLFLDAVAALLPQFTQVRALIPARAVGAWRDMEDPRFAQVERVRLP